MSLVLTISGLSLSTQPCHLRFLRYISVPSYISRAPCADEIPFSCLSSLSLAQFQSPSRHVLFVGLCSVLLPHACLPIHVSACLRSPLLHSRAGSVCTHDSGHRLRTGALTYCLSASLPAWHSEPNAHSIGSLGQHD